jgi:hypothetical protein
VDIKMLGYAGSQLDMIALAEMQVDQISATWQIPQPILMGKEAGVVQGSMVNERTYFATLDGDHSLLNKFIRQFVAIDPFFQRLFKKHGIKPQSYLINWGLRQVMTKEQEADWKMRVYTNIISKMSFATFDECRAEAGLPSFQKYFCDQEHPERVGMCEKNYGISAVQLDTIVPNLGQWRQRVMQEILNTPEEKKAEALAENNMPNVSEITAKGQGAENPSMGAPAREAKPNPDKTKLEKVAARMEREHDADTPEMIARMAAIKAKEDMVTTIVAELDELKKGFDKSIREISINDLAALGGCSKTQVYPMMEIIDKIRKNKEAKKNGK